MSWFEIGTFVDRDRERPIKKSHVRAYSTWFNPEWDGCLVYNVEAGSGKEAKRIAILQRVEHENDGDPLDEAGEFF